MDLLIGIATIMLLSACTDEGRFFNQIFCYKPFINAFEETNKIERTALKIYNITSLGDLAKRHYRLISFGRAI